jgi:hypothetical protein
MTFRPDDDTIPAARHRISRIDTYEVAVSDFDRIEEVASTVGSDLTFATLGLSVAVTLTVTLNTVTIASERLHDEFFIVMCISYAVAIICGYRWWRQRGELRKQMNRIRAMQEGPLGEEGKEFKAAELANMPLQAAPQLIQPAQHAVAAVVVEKATGEIQVDIKESIAAPAADAMAKNE